MQRARAALTGVKQPNLCRMLLLGLVMAVEKNHPWGRRQSMRLGGALPAVPGLVVERAPI
jgi:predicted metal-binding membrane protein